MIVLIHTSKTMRPAAIDTRVLLTTPVLLPQTETLQSYLAALSVTDIESIMHVSNKLAASTQQLLQAWAHDAAQQRPAVDSFLGDIYSGLQVADWSQSDRAYAQQHMRILSGLYGILRPLDGIYPYRFEMGYKTPGFITPNLYQYWGDSIALTLPHRELIVDLSAVEYGKVVTKYIDARYLVTPRFLTISPKTGEPTFVVVHAKIARGAFAGWMIRHKIEQIDQLRLFCEIGYAYDEALSTTSAPVFVCQEFGGLGLSVRLT